MREEVILAGFGGQGVMFAGKLLTYLGMEQGEHVTYMPSYGAEVRGGTANCAVIVSSEEIASPVIFHPSSSIVMNSPSLDKFEPRIKEDGLLIVNTSLIKRKVGRKDLEIVEIPATEMAIQLGNVRVANMVALGAYIRKRGIVNLKNALSSLEKVLPRHRHSLLEINRQALKEGAKYHCKL